MKYYIDRLSKVRKLLENLNKLLSLYRLLESNLTHNVKIENLIIFMTMLEIN